MPDVRVPSVASLDRLFRCLSIKGRETYLKRGEAATRSARGAAGGGPRVSPGGGTSRGGRRSGRRAGAPGGDLDFFSESPAL